MKRNLKFLSLLLLLPVLFSACQEEENATIRYEDKFFEERAQHLSQPFEDRKEYLSKYLTIMGKGILSQVQDPEFRASVYEGVDQEFDGETNVLIEKLLDINPKADVIKHGVNNFLQKDGISHNFENLINAFDFRAINAEKYFPQIGVAFYREFVEPTVVQGKNMDQLPIIAINDALEGEEGLTGYRLDATGNIIQMDELITEDFARKNEVWVIGLNERVTSYEDITAFEAEPEFDQEEILDKSNNVAAREEDVPIDLPGGGGGGGGGGGTPFGSDINCNNDPRVPIARPPLIRAFRYRIPDSGFDVRMVRAKIGSHKEEWYNFGSEIHMMMTGLIGPGAGTEQYWGITLDKLEGIFIPDILEQADYGVAFFKRKQVGNTTKNVNSTTVKFNNSFFNYDCVRPYAEQFYWGTTYRDYRNRAMCNNSTFTGAFEDEREEYIAWAVYEADISAYTRGRRETISWSHEGVDREASVVFQSRDNSYINGWWSRSFIDDSDPCRYLAISSSNTAFAFITAEGVEE